MPLGFPLPLVALIVSVLVAFWLAATVNRRSRVPGKRSFVWLMIAVAEWSLASTGHWLAGSLEARIAWAQVQYVGISSVPPLWFLFTAEYAGVDWIRSGGPRTFTPGPRTKKGARYMLWAVPVVTVMVALTAHLHDALWTTVTMT